MSRPEVFGIRPAALPAWRDLVAALDGITPPCTGRDEWTSESAQARAYAAGHCTGCPALAACHRFAAINHETANVFGGIDFTRPAGRPAQPKEQTA